MKPNYFNFLFSASSLLSGVGPKLVKRLENLCGRTVKDILWHMPIGVCYRPVLTTITHACHGNMGTLCVTIDEHVVPKTKRQPYIVYGHMGNFAVSLVYFNYRGDYLTKIMPVGENRWISGRLELFNQQIRIIHPDYVSGHLSSIPEYETIYPLTAGVTSKIISKLMREIAHSLPDFPEWLNAEWQKKEKLPSWKTAVLLAHHPKTADDVSHMSPARKRLAYDELLANQLALCLARGKMKKKRGISFNGDGRLRKRLLANLPFELTNAQKRVLDEVYADSISDYKMVRLVQGDVGSGKTIVALLSLLNVVECGYQGVIMAPTDILARQHCAVLKKYCEPLGVRVALLSGREKGKNRAELLSELAQGKIHILVGTHAVFVDDVVYHHVGLIVIDEQHKFGVAQRLALSQKQETADLLVMTATPIPRTLALTGYGDMDISQLDEKPLGRQPIETSILSGKKAPELTNKLLQIIHQSSNTQVYWVCPLVSESAKTDIVAAEKRYNMLKELFGERVGLVHGQMKGAEKDAVMKQFAEGKLSVLVSTTVIEVGVDVPTATIMVIEHAERFGLAQLHQLRGRIGRGQSLSKCILMYGADLTETAKKRLKIMRETSDGFLIAEEDLKLRGAGDVLGIRQSGLPTFRIADLSEHADLLWTARKEAQMIVNQDPYLETKRGQALKNLLYLFEKDSEIKTLKAG